jgi:hypothetical protein
MFILYFFLTFSWIGAQIQDQPPEGKVIAESWMGVYINGVKVGYTHSLERLHIQDQENLIRSYSESLMKVSRLGGNPIEIATIQESLYSDDKKPLKTKLRTKMSETETVIEAEVKSDTVVFKLGKDIVREIPYQQEFYFGVPLEKIIEGDGLIPGKKINLKILDPVAYSLSDCQFEVIDEEDILLLGEKKRLWHVRSEIDSIVPIVVDEWISREGVVFKSIMSSGFITSISLKMPKEKALIISEESFDIAFSSVIMSNVVLPEPQNIQRMKFRVWGIPEDELKRFPWDNGSQKILEKMDDSFVLETTSLIFSDEDAMTLPIQEEVLRESLASTVFCQANDGDIQRVAQEIVGEERNSWRAAKKIAEWIKKEMTSSYDVGFAKASEILRNREGDCTEYAVLFVALCRAVGIPARAAVGIMYAGGMFAYHMWPEVYVGRWVGLDARWLARDESSGEYYTDATHIKFGHSNLDEKIFQEMVRSISEVIGNIKLEIMEYEHQKNLEKDSSPW